MDSPITKTGPHVFNVAIRVHELLGDKLERLVKQAREKKKEKANSPK